MPLGLHVSIAGGIANSVERAVSLGCDALQCFGGNPRGWKQRALNSREALDFRHRRAEAGLSVVAVHASYLINLSSPDDALFKRSVELFTYELKRADNIGADFLVVHIGSSRGQGIEFGVKRATEGIRGAFDVLRGLEVELLLENTAGSGNTVGADLKDIGTILDDLERSSITAGLCFDTCHGFASGYLLAAPEDAAALVSEIDRSVGLERLKLIHLNDSKGKLGSRLDRHEHLGMGQIGRKGLGTFLREQKIQGIPLILETPKDSDDADIKNLATAKRLSKPRG